MTFSKPKKLIENSMATLYLHLYNEQNNFQNMWKYQEHLYIVNKMENNLASMFTALQVK